MVNQDGMWDFLDVFPKVRASIDLLRERDWLLLGDNMLSEVAIAHRIAVYLENRFPRFDVDCEYNKMTFFMKCKASANADLVKLKKKLEQAVRKREVAIIDYFRTDGFIESVSAEAIVDALVRPDICVHRRGQISPVDNLLIIELKKTSNKTGRELDLEKLNAYTSTGQPFRYQFGLFLDLNVGGVVSEAKLYPDGLVDSEHLKLMFN